MNVLYYGDNLNVLREHIKDESVDLIYLDPPFNSKRDYNLLFKSPEGDRSKAQTVAFEDTWQWGEGAEEAFHGVMHSGHSAAAVMLNALRSFMGESDVMAYLAMMAVRLLELHRVLKPTGSIYLHCDPTASHYLKVLMDAIFGSKNFRNEVIWDYSFRLMDLPKFYNRKHDVLLFYAKSANNWFDMPKTSWTKDDLLKSRKQKIHVDENGVEWIWMPGGRGHSKNKLKQVDQILKEGKAISDVWPIPVISSSSKERLGYPTQKPLALLERIVRASSAEGHTVLDPFCGCGTAVDAAEMLRRQWIGIDITHLAVGLIERRLKARYADIAFDIKGIPKDIDGLRAMAQQARNHPRLYYELQYWAINQIPAAQHAQNQKKGADRGIDGIVWLRPAKGTYEKAIISVKAGEHVSVQMLRDMRGTVEREKAKLGIFLSLAEPSKPMKTEAAAAGMAELEGVKCPRIQILTFEDLLNGKQPQLPYADYSLALPKAQEQEKEQTQLL